MCARVCACMCMSVWVCACLYVRTYGRTARQDGRSELRLFGLKFPGLSSQRPGPSPHPCPHACHPRFPPWGSHSFGMLKYLGLGGSRVDLRHHWRWSFPSCGWAGAEMGSVCGASSMAKTNSNFLDGASYLLPRPADWRPAASPGPCLATLPGTTGWPLQATGQP